MLLLMLVMRVSSSTTREFTERKNVAQRILITAFLLLDMVLMRDLVKLTGSSRTGLSSSKIFQIIHHFVSVGEPAGGMKDM